MNYFIITNLFITILVIALNCVSIIYILNIKIY